MGLSKTRSRPHELLLSHTTKAELASAPLKMLSKDLLEVQVGQIDLLMGMYPDADAVVLSDAATSRLDALRQYLDSDSTTAPPGIGDDISLILRLETKDDPEYSHIGDLELDIIFPLSSSSEAVDAPPAMVKLRQGAWMSKADTAAINESLIPDDDLFSTIESVKEAASSHLKAIQAQATPAAATTRAESAEIARVWFYFPSISTRSKRDDLVNEAPGYGLTGFLLAGKPGILCLEGGSQAVDDYMKYIKTESWGDIPAHHKKVSEKFRQLDIKERVFSDMQEITDQLDKRGERANRSDMKALEAWLGDRGLQEAFSKVLI